MNKRFYNNPERHSAAISGLTMVGMWAFFEANFWFIAPDFILIILAFVAPTRWLSLSLAALGGSLLGGILYFALLKLSFTTFEEILFATPFVGDRMLAFIERMYSEHGYLGILVQSVSFMSFKIWTYQAVKFEFSPWLYFPLVMLSRCFRLMLVTWIASRIGKWLNERARPYFLVLVVIYSVAFVTMLIVVEK